MVGVTAGGDVKDDNDERYDIKAGVNLSIAIETPMDKGRIGLYLASQRNKTERIDTKTKLHILQFQSSVVYPLKNGFRSYVGLGLGGGYLDAPWVDNHWGFSGSAFTGIEYPISETVSFNSQLRWLGVSVDDNANTAVSM
ncbi:porin family protein [Vibrio sp. SM6]|uniref:Porin family protein n=1 Tax=Vibrio agarilyticus TaxID=2726741 RepID=A0A7X8TMK1_9VIBR|nr:porin family protein [Vibrio agarilyticus]NLS11496.1 porin family protein [Vibrio agarilyticus]